MRVRPEGRLCVCSLYGGGGAGESVNFAGGGPRGFALASVVKRLCWGVWRTRGKGKGSCERAAESVLGGS